LEKEISRIVKSRLGDMANEKFENS
jgi:hypothetical protein